MTNFVLLSLTIWFIAVNSSNGCLTNKATAVAKLTKCHGLLKDVIINADLSKTSENFELAYCEFIDECENGDEKVEEDEEESDNSDDPFVTVLQSVLELEVIPTCNKTNNNAIEEAADDIIDIIDEFVDIPDEEITNAIKNTTEIVDEISTTTNETLEETSEGLQESREVLDDSKKSWEDKEIKILANLFQLF